MSDNSESAIFDLIELEPGQYALMSDPNTPEAKRALEQAFCALFGERDTLPAARDNFALDLEAMSSRPAKQHVESYD